MERRSSKRKRPQSDSLSPREQPAPRKLKRSEARGDVPTWPDQASGSAPGSADEAATLTLDSLRVSREINSSATVDNASPVAALVRRASVESLRRWVLQAAETYPEFEASLHVVAAEDEDVDEDEDAADTSEQLFQLVCRGDAEAIRSFRSAKDSKAKAKARFNMLMRGKQWQGALHYALAVDRVEQTGAVPLLLAKLGRYEEAVTVSKTRHATRCSLAVPVFEALVAARQDQLAYNLALQFLSASTTHNSRLWRISEADKNRVCKTMLTLAASLHVGLECVEFLLREVSGVRFDELAATAKELKFDTSAVLRLQQRFLHSVSSCPASQLVAMCKEIAELEQPAPQHALLVDIFEHISKMIPVDDSKSLLAICDILLASSGSSMANKRLHCFCAFLFVEKLAKGCIEHGIVWEKSSPRAQLMNKAVSSMLMILEETGYDIILAKRVVRLLAEGHGHNFAILLKWYRRLFNKLSSGVTDFSSLVYCAHPSRLEKMDADALCRIAETLRINDPPSGEVRLRAAIAAERSRLFNRAVCIQYLHTEVTSCRDHLQSLPSSRLVSLRIPSRMVVGFGNFLMVIAGTKALVVAHSLNE